jgi:hypothetical protein
MSIIRSRNTVVSSEEERTFLAEIETPHTGEYVVRVHREVIQRDASGETVGTPTGAAMVSRMAKDVMTESVQLPNGANISARAIIAALPLFFDRWAEEDAARRTAP